ncbi:two component transcriptional regulator, LuxR family [Methylobacterium sp. 4-46]|uniref:response regulator n=1 Tax=unclassified Methylobacterium TaxID=2615210 RepID=UPI000152C26E|nr:MULTISPECIES: response regulator transcription factor [Methylobacterium]ACA19252.1 two component transcriptional regulator, LuxR family [Methylobacterium sp. 4-46]WFT78459.1 response regulator transcription factor [Methylobacterium nodulans]
MNVLVVDDHPIVLQGCRRVLEDAGVEAVHEATCIRAGYRSFHRHRPDVVVADLTFHGAALKGLDLIRRIRAVAPGTRILVFTMHDDPVIVARALDSGALGYVLKDTASAELHQAFERVRAGEPYLDPSLAAEVALLRARPRPEPLAGLTARERQILALLGAGRSHGAIAAELALSYKTVANACSQMRHKLGARSLADLLRIALQAADRAP